MKSASIAAVKSSTRAALVGAGVVFTFSRKDRAGTYAALVRRVLFGRREVVGLVVQLAGGNPFASTRSARFRGEKVKLEGRELWTLRVFVRGRARALDDVLDRARLSS